MSRHARNRKAVNRGHNNAPTVKARNRKDRKQFDRWFSGLHAERLVDLHGRVRWAKLPTGRGLLHNGRKP